MSTLQIRTIMSIIGQLNHKQQMEIYDALPAAMRAHTVGSISPRFKTNDDGTYDFLPWLLRQCDLKVISYIGAKRANDCMSFIVRHTHIFMELKGIINEDADRLYILKSRANKHPASKERQEFFEQMAVDDEAKFRITKDEFFHAMYNNMGKRSVVVLFEPNEETEKSIEETRCVNVLFALNSYDMKEFEEPKAFLLQYAICGLTHNSAMGSAAYEAKVKQIMAELDAIYATPDYSN